MYRFSDEEFHVFVQFLKKEHPKAYSDTMAHLQGYQEFMVEQAKTWFELKKKSPRLKLPRSIAKTLTRTGCDKPEVMDSIFDADYDEDDDFFNSPRNLKIIDSLLDTPCPKAND
jgi:hypothetical protein